MSNVSFGTFEFIHVLDEDNYGRIDSPFVEHSLTRDACHNSLERSFEFEFIRWLPPQAVNTTLEVLRSTAKHTILRV